MKESLHIAVACGGTGGHTLPGLAAAAAAREAGHRVTLWTAGKQVEGTVLNSWEGDVECIPASGLHGGVRSIGGVMSMIAASARCYWRMQKQKPDVLLAMGSYASFGPVMAAHWSGVPVVLHEANTIPGRAVQLLSRYSRLVATTFPGTDAHLAGVRIELIGLPVRQDIGCAEPAVARALFPGLQEGLPTVLVVGGSQGAQVLNTTVADLLAKRSGIQVLHLAGRQDPAGPAAVYQAAGISHSVHGYIDHMAAAYALSDIVVCRAGAATCAELSVCQLPAVYVPYPHAASNHQEANARAMQAAGFGELVLEKDVATGLMPAFDRVIAGGKPDSSATLPDHRFASARLLEFLVAVSAE